MSRSVTQCLTKALDTIRGDESLDESVRDRMVQSMEATIARHRGDPQRQLIAAIQQSRELNRTAHIARVAKLANEAAIERITGRLESVPIEERMIALRNLIEYDRNYRYQDTPHVSGMVRAAESRTHRALGEIWENVSGNRLGVMVDTKFAKTFHQELRGVDTGDALARNLVKRFREVMKPHLETLRQAGVYVEEMPNYAPQTHDIARVNSNYADWRAFLRENLDPEHHPDPDASIERIYNTLMTKDLHELDRPTITTNRQVFFKSPDAEFEYNNRFGERNFHELLTRHVVALARKAVLARELGPNPIRNVELMAARVAEDTRQARITAAREGNKKLERKLARVERRALPLIGNQQSAANVITRGLVGEFATPENQTLANYAASGRNMMTGTMLGQVAWAAIIQDAWISLTSARFHTGGFASGIMGQLNGVRSVMTDAGAREYAKDLGVFTHSIYAAMTERFSSPFAAIETAAGRTGAGLDETLRSATAKYAHASQRLSLSHTVDRVLRSGYMLMSSRNLARNLTSRNWGDLHPRVQRMLQANAIDEGVYGRLQQVVEVRERVGGVEVNNLPPDLYERVISMLYREADLAVVHPGQYDKLMLSAYQRAGTLGGEFVAASTQFQSWPVSFFRGAMSREIAAGGTGMIGFFGAMIATGTLTVQAYAMLRGEPTFEWDSPVLWQRGMVRSGLLTPVGEGIVDAAGFGGGAPRGSLLDGPVTSTVARSLGNLGMASMDAIDGEGGKAARRILQTADMTVIPNVWWFQMGLTNRAMDAAMETLDPQYVLDRERRMMREGRRDD